MKLRPSRPTTLPFQSARLITPSQAFDARTDQCTDEAWRALRPAPAVVDLGHTVRLLALIADDEAINLDNRNRVVEALQNHGHLLCDGEVEIILAWLASQKTEAAGGQKGGDAQPSPGSCTRTQDKATAPGTKRI